MSGKWRFVMAIGDFSISLAQTGMIPLREAAEGTRQFHQTGFLI